MATMLRDSETRKETSHNSKDLILEGPRRRLVNRLVRLDYMKEAERCVDVKYEYPQRDSLSEGVTAFDQRRLILIFEGGTKRSLGSASNAWVKGND